MKKKIRKLDFTATQPSFLIKGKKKVKTTFGGILSLAAITFIIVYSWFLI
jgi:hypothetical protein